MKKIEERQCEIAEAAEKALTNLETRLTKFQKQTYNDALIKKRDISENIALLVRKIQGEIKCNNYDDELETIEKVINGEDKLQITKVIMLDLEKKCNMKKQEISEIFQKTKDYQEKMIKFVCECKKKEEIIEFWEHNSAEALKEIYQKRMLQIRECELVLQTKCNTLKEQVIIFNQLEKECQPFREEKEKLKKNIKELKFDLKEFDTKIYELSNRHDELEKNLIILNSTISEKKNEILNLESVIESRKALVSSSGKANMFKEMKLLYQSNVIYIFDQKVTMLYIYHFELKRVLKLDSSNLNLSANNGCVQINDDLYVSGGFNAIKMIYSKTFSKIKFVDVNTVKNDFLSDMLLGKSQHRLVMLDADTIYSLGGRTRDKKFLDYCEKYNIGVNKWEKAPTLNEAKLNISATTFNCSLLYVFGGYKGTFTNKIEVLNTAKPGTGWKLLKCSHTNDWVAKDEMGCFQISMNEIIIFGGIEGLTGSTDSVFILNAGSNTIVKQTNKLSKKDWFDMRTATRLNEEVMVIAGYFGNDIHIYKETDKSWSIIPAKEWNTTLK